MPVPDLRLADELVDGDIWSRLPGEPQRAFDAFIRYRDQPPSERSVRKVNEKGPQWNGSELKWSSRWNWPARAVAWDAEQDRLHRARMVEARKSMADRQMRGAQLAQNKIIQWLVDLDPATLTPHEAARWYEVAVRVERMAVGEPDRLEVTHQGETVKVALLTPEETLARLAQVQRKIGTMLDGPGSAAG